MNQVYLYKKISEIADSHHPALGLRAWAWG